VFYLLQLAILFAATAAVETRLLTTQPNDNDFWDFITGSALALALLCEQ
jgi:hypothetical protein